MNFFEWSILELNPNAYKLIVPKTKASIWKKRNGHLIHHHISLTKCWALWKTCIQPEKLDIMGVRVMKI